MRLTKEEARFLSGVLGAVLEAGLQNQVCEHHGVIDEDRKVSVMNATRRLELKLEAFGEDGRAGQWCNWRITNSLYKLSIRINNRYKDINPAK